VRWLASTSSRTFVLWPILLVGLEAALQRGVPQIEIWALPLLVWGYLQYRLVGDYRLTAGGGGPGISIPPERLVTEGPYRLTRHPMYLGIVSFHVGATIAMESLALLVITLVYVIPFTAIRIRAEDRVLASGFGDEFRAFSARVPAFVPFAR